VTAAVVEAYQWLEDRPRDVCFQLLCGQSEHQLNGTRFATTAPDDIVALSTAQLALAWMLDAIDRCNPLRTWRLQEILLETARSGQRARYRRRMASGISTT
jgi:hypothetical protein